MWRFLDLDMIDGAYSAALFHTIGKYVGQGRSDQTIMFWRVGRPTLYLGYHQIVEDEVDTAWCSSNNVDIIRRILGGGCGYCDSDQILYSVIGREGIPGDVRAAYKEVLTGPLLALKSLGLEGEIDVNRNSIVVGGRKISGNAQGRFDGAVLVNGSFLLDFDFASMDRVLKHPTRNLPQSVRTAREGMVTLSDLMERPDPAAIKQVLHAGFKAALGVDTYAGAVSEQEQLLAEELTLLYSSRDWTYRMDDKRKKRQARKIFSTTGGTL